MHRWLYLLILPVFTLVGCNQGTPSLPGSDPSAPTAQAPSDHSWLWGVGGYLLGRMSAPSASPAMAPSHTTVINKTVVNKVIQAPAVVKPPAVSTAPKFSAPAPSISFRPSTPAPSYSRPSYSSGYSYRSSPSVSYGGGFRR